MPFKSEAQRRFLWAKHPEIAKRWSDKYGSKPISSGLLESHAKKKKSKKSS